MLKIIPPVYFCISLFLSIVLNYAAPVAPIIVFPYTCSGFVVMWLGFVLLGLARRLFKINNIPLRPGEEVAVLLVGGPYKFTRNPIYLGFTIILIGASISLGTLTSWAGPIAFWLVINSIFIPFEEKKLESAFGKRYIEYKQKVRRWL
ncbi:MAG: isoprenylcysteine carboxylmethyltransferase family protein [Candidatus Omnitrophica bacterium]|nr:isoprenylcysteine carboxylmethyltransferase family protein [Candidatus Omnitrophota bacterium]MDE2231015.1 isoprenylcysteine carboxylmethyltransferase family protein [Candidatus Omnitrophota bacterium]